MANRNSAGFGFIPAGTLGNTPSTQGLSEYFIVAADSVNKFNGMGVRVTAGYIVTGEDSATGTSVGVLQGIGDFTLRSVNMNFIVEEPTNKPSMLTVCFTSP